MIFWEKQKAISALYEKQTRQVRISFGLTQMQYDILMFLHNNPQFDTAADIVRIRLLTKSHVSAALKELEERGFLYSEYLPGNRKSRHLRLSDTASDIIAAGEQAQNAFGHQLLKDFSEAEMEMCKELFLRMCENASARLEENTNESLF